MVTSDSSTNSLNLEDKTPLTSTTIRRRITDGGVRAWCTVAGSWFMMLSTLGYLYTFGVYQDFYTREFLSDNLPSKIAWIGSLQLAMPFAFGLFSGKLLDIGYFHAVVGVGSIIFSFSLFMLSLAKPHHYYQVFLSQGVGMGLGLGLTFVPSLSILVQHFERRRSLASGIALTGSSVGAIIFPIMLNHLIPKIGFAQAVRATGYIVLGCLLAANGLMRMNLDMKDIRSKSAPPNIAKFFREVPYVLGILGTLVGLFGVYFPIFYLQLYAVQHGVGSMLAFYSLSIVSASGAVGRIVANILADKFGPWTVQVPVSLITGGTIWALLGVNNTRSLIVVSILYGFFSGAVLSLSIASWASMAKVPQEAGARTGLALAIGSYACLGSAPAQGALLTNKYHWIRPIGFSGSMVFAGGIIFIFVRQLLVKERGTQKV